MGREAPARVECQEMLPGRGRALRPRGPQLEPEIRAPCVLSQVTLNPLMLWLLLYAQGRHRVCYTRECDCPVIFLQYFRLRLDESRTVIKKEIIPQFLALP